MSMTVQFRLLSGPVVVGYCCCGKVLVIKQHETGAYYFHKAVQG